MVDTSIWVDHLRNGDKTLFALLDSGSVLIHPFVVGELALGQLRQRETVLSALLQLSRVNVATDTEILHFIDHHALAGCGIGYVDTHLLASAKLSPPAKLWTRDRRLFGVAHQLGLAMAPA
ncbi:MAG TPA: type II toxin-antitoxin system VapC family toxin [Rhizomicrobium sp.]